MNTNNSKTSLKNLAELCIDGRENYKTAAKKTKISPLKSLFTLLFQEREGILNAINKELIDLGTTVVIERKTNRTTFNIETVLSSDKIDLILEECKQNENLFLDEMDSILKNKTEISISSVKLLQDARYTIWKRLESIDKVKEVEE